jgi:hypothetical protein
MALTVSEYPALVSLVRNQMVFKITSDNIYSSAGSHAVLIALFGQAFVGQQITFAWGSNSITFDVVATPDSSGTQIRESDIMLPAVWCPLVAQDLNKNYYLSRDFKIYYQLDNGKHEIVIASYEQSDDYTLTITETLEDYTEFSNVAGAAPVARTHYGIRFQTWWNPDGGDLEMINEEFNSSPDDSYNFFFDIHELFNQPESLYSTFAYPEVITTSNFTIRNEMMRSFLVRYCETYDNLSQGILTSSVFFVLNGGISAWKERDFYANNTNFWEYLQTSKPFLTWCPASKKTCVNATEKLYFLMWKNETDLAVEAVCKIYYTDGTDSTIVITGVDMTYLDLWELYVSPLKITGLFTTEPTKTVKKYDIYMRAVISQEIISETKTFVMDYNHYENERFFIFKNSLGAYETLRCTGRASITETYERTIISQAQPVQNSAAFRENKQTAVDATDKMVINTGWLDEDTNNWVQDFFISEDVYEMKSGKLFPVIITSNEVFRSKDDNKMFFREFEMIPGSNRSIYTPEPDDPFNPGDFSDDYNSDYQT